MFLELPDQEEYPEYYKVIPHPIDMEHIHQKVINGIYANETEFIHDFEILFQNARHFNEEGSEIYEDSVTLEKALKKKRRILNIADGKDMSPGGKGGNSNASTVNRSHELLHFIRSYADETGRVLSAIFERLPSRVVSNHTLATPSSIGGRLVELHPCLKSFCRVGNFEE